MDVAATSRSFLGSCGGAALQDTLITGGAQGPLGRDKEREARGTYKKAKKQGARQKRGEGLGNAGRDKVHGGGQTLNGFNPRTGLRNRRYQRDNEYRLAP